MSNEKKSLLQHLVVQHNDIIDGAYKLGLQEFRLIYLLISKLDSRNSQNKDGYKVTIKEFNEVYSLEHKGMYAQLRSAVKTIMRTPIQRYIGANKRGNPIVEEIAWADSITYEEGNGEFDSYITIHFSKKIEPYLFNLKGRFTSVVFEDLANLNTPFSMRLYLWLHALSINGKVKTITLEIEWIKERAGISNKYNQFNQFKLKVIEPAIDRINQDTSLNLTYTLNKEGKSYKSITFNLNSKQLTNTKQKRDRLPRRPKVTKDSHGEGEWARECIKIITEHFKEISKTNDLWLDIPDIKRLINCYQIIGDTFQVNAWEKYLNRRTEAKHNKNKLTKNTIKQNEDTHLYDENGIEIDEDGIPLF